MTGVEVSAVRAEGAAAPCGAREMRLKEPADVSGNASRIGRPALVDLPSILPFDRPPTAVPHGLFPLVRAGSAGRIAAMSVGSRVAAVWDWCVLFVRTVAAPQAVFWFLLWNAIRPRPRRSGNA